LRQGSLSVYSRTRAQSQEGSITSFSRTFLRLRACQRPFSGSPHLVSEVPLCTLTSKQDALLLTAATARRSREVNRIFEILPYAPSSLQPPPPHSELRRDFRVPSTRKFVAPQNSLPYQEEPPSAPTILPTVGPLDDPPTGYSYTSSDVRCVGGCRDAMPDRSSRRKRLDVGAVIRSPDRAARFAANARAVAARMGGRGVQCGRMKWRRRGHVSRRQHARGA